MTIPHSDAFVFFGATGDLAFKKIFPSLQAMAGDATLFVREDDAEEAWRIVDPVLKAGKPVHPYEPGTWGPKKVEQVTPSGGWQNPVVTT